MASPYEDHRVGTYTPYVDNCRPRCIHNITGFECECEPDSSQEDPIPPSKATPPIRDQPVPMVVEPYCEINTCMANVVPDFDEEVQVNPFSDPYHLEWKKIDAFRKPTLQNEHLEEADWDHSFLDDLAVQFGDEANAVRWSPTLDSSDASPLLGDFTVLSSTLHMFVDASKEAICMVTYLEAHYMNHPMTVRQVFAKSKLAPANVRTIPRLELVAAAMGVTVLKKLEKACGIAPENAILWSDAAAVLDG